MIIYKVKEGATGVLELTDQDGNIEQFRPNCDLDAALELLYKFYDLKTTSNTFVKRCFFIDDIDWFPTTISMLYWQYFFQIVKYRPLVDMYLDGKIGFSEISNGKFFNLIQILSSFKRKRSLITKIAAALRWIYSLIVWIRNKVVPYRRGDFLFFRYGIDDFRTKELLEQLEERYDVLQVTTVKFKYLLNNFFKRSVYILPVVPLRNTGRLKLLTGHRNRIFVQALFYVEAIVSSHRREYRRHYSCFRRFNYRLFWGWMMQIPSTPCFTRRRIWVIKLLVSSMGSMQKGMKLM